MVSPGVAKNVERVVVLVGIVNVYDDESMVYGLNFDCRDVAGGDWDLSDGICGEFSVY